MDQSARHLRLLTETIAAVNSTLDLQEVLDLVADGVSEALGTDACFVYLYDERADELVLRATHGTRVEELTRRPRMRPGEGITGVAAAERAPVMIQS
jgi:signal transduction protein with GAF and PtsI domain